MISVTCGQCQAHYDLKDEVMGKKVRCSNCGNIFVAGQKQDIIQKTSPSEGVTIKIPDEKKENGSNALHDRGIFSANIYGVKQKRIAVNEKALDQKKVTHILSSYDPIQQNISSRT